MNSAIAYGKGQLKQIAHIVDEMFSIQALFISQLSWWAQFCTHYFFMCFFSLKFSSAEQQIKSKLKTWGLTTSQNKTGRFYETQKAPIFVRTKQWRLSIALF
jgi:hypothetical protein